MQAVAAEGSGYAGNSDVNEEQIGALEESFALGAHMKNQKAIVTIAIGEKYVGSWKKYCQPNWQAYAHKYGYDLICLEHPLDVSSRAKLRSPAWQKCLILSQGFASDYKTVVWIDSDIVINDNAPDVAIGVPANKVGAVDAYEFSEVFPKRVYKICLLYTSPSPRDS